MEPILNPYPEQPRKNNKLMPIIVVVVVLLIAIIGSFLIINKTKKVEEKKDVAVETKEISPSPLPKIDKKTVKIQVINGTGTPGQAGLVVKALEEAGYTPDNIKTGNADKFDNSTTTIEARINYEEIVKDIEKELKSTFAKITVKSTNLDNDSEFDIVVVTGGKIFEAVIPTASVSATLSPTTTPTLTPTPTP